MDVSLLHVSTVDEADARLSQLGCHRGGISIMAPKVVFLTIQVHGLLPQAANILKQEMLAKGGEVAVPGGALSLESPRVDCTIAGTLAQYRKLVNSLRDQPFELPHLATDLQTFTELAVEKPHPQQFGSLSRIAIGGLVDCDRDVPGNSDRPSNVIGHAWNLLEERADFLVIEGSDPTLVAQIVQELSRSASCSVCAWTAGQTIPSTRPSFPLVLQQQSGFPESMKAERAVSGPVLAIPQVGTETAFLEELLQASIPSSRLFVTAILHDGASASSDLSRLPRLDAVVLLQEDLARFPVETRAAIMTRFADRGVSVFMTDVPLQLRTLLEASWNDPWSS